MAWVDDFAARWHTIAMRAVSGRRSRGGYGVKSSLLAVEHEMIRDIPLYGNGASKVTRSSWSCDKAHTFSSVVMLHKKKGS